MIKRLFLAVSLIVIGSQNIALAGTVSFDQLATSSDLTVAKYNADLNTIFQDHNSNIQSSNLAADTVAEVDMADDANPRLRDYELGGAGTECEMVYTGLLTATTSGTLTGSVPAGTAYPRGYRVVKSSATPKTFTASRWTFVDIDISGNFTYQEVTIGGATPAVSPNSIRLSRVSTDGTQVAAVQDLRTLSCTSAKPSSVIQDSGEANLDNFLRNGTPVRRYSQAGRSVAGFAQGAFVSWDTHSTFKVTAGSLLINGKYRSISSDLTITTGNDDPVNGTSGLDTGSVTGGPVTYYVYGVADQDSVPTYTITYSTSGSAPSGVTNYRLIGQIKTDATNLFTSFDTVTTHGISERELVGGWVNLNGTSTIVSRDGFNVTGILDRGTGQYTVIWDNDFRNSRYAVALACKASGADCLTGIDSASTGMAAGSIEVYSVAHSGAKTDADDYTVIAIGDTRR